jgi:iron complex transport system substrate-binding protein
MPAITRGQRIASLLASGTEIVAALGLEDRLVGISHECDHPAHVLDRPRLSRPRFDPAGLSSGEVDAAVRAAMRDFGSVYEVDGDALENLAPDLVLTQAVCEVCAVPTPGVRELVEQRALDTQVLSLDAHTIDEILDTIDAVGSAAAVRGRAREVIADLRARMAAVAFAVAGRPVQRVLAVEWLDPPFLPGHWVPEQIARAGGDCIVGHAGGHSSQAGWTVLEGLDPDVLVVMPCGYGLAETVREADRFADRLRGIAPRAIAEGRAFAVDGSSFFNRSGPRFIDGIEIMATLLHPEAFQRPLDDAAQAWQPRV